VRCVGVAVDLVLRPFYEFFFRFHIGVRQKTKNNVETN